MIVELVILAVIVTLLPLLFKPIGENLEVFLFCAGVLGVTLTSQWSLALVREAAAGPIKITAAVLVASLLFHFLQQPLEAGFSRLHNRFGPRPLVLAIIALTGLLSSLLTAIIASLIMVEAVARLKLDAKNETTVVVLACFSIGLGAALTPFGEPLAAVAITKLAGDPYRAGTWFLLRNLWMYVIPGILGVSVLSLFLLRPPSGKAAPVAREERETLGSAFLRTGKVYVFVVGLIFLGAAFTPVIDRVVGSVSDRALFWVNISSAVLDNATLTAAEIVPSMTRGQIVASLMGLLIAGGMLVPGNIPNIIAAGRLRIGNRDWAKVGVPVGMSMMLLMFLTLLLKG